MIPKSDHYRHISAEKNQRDGRKVSVFLQYCSHQYWMGSNDN